MTLTDKGRALIAKVYPENEAMLDAIFGKWNHEERKGRASAPFPAGTGLRRNE